MNAATWRPALRSSLGRVRGEAWPVVQAAVAAGVAWFISYRLLGHAQPVFAPTAAVVSLAVRAGGRGRQAIEMLVGVGVGVAVGELLVLFLGTGAPQVTLAAAAAMIVVAILVDTPLPLIQAGASAVIVVALQSPESGGGRILDALVGAGVALVVSQVLFPPSPVALLKDAAHGMLGCTSEALQASADALSEGKPAIAEASLDDLRGAGLDALSAFVAARDTGGEVSRRTLRGRREAARFRRLDARLARTDLLFENALLLARSARILLLEERAPPGLAPALRELSAAAWSLAEDPEDPGLRRTAGAAAGEAAKRARALPPAAIQGATDYPTALAAECVRLAAADLLHMAAPDETPAPAAPRGEKRPEGSC